MDTRRFRSDQPVYLQIADALRAAYEPGRQLPSVPVLSREWKVSRETARNAVDVLRSEGLVVSWQGKGTYYRSHEDRDRDNPVARQLADILARLEDVETRLAEVEQRQSR